ncbi:MAG: proton-conducting membrane transporter [Oscillospiraceae bacterium]|nr:proton-conducting membrane transporter [Oscillospiraceae bacterium]
MRSLTLLSVLFPILAGTALLIWRPGDDRLRNRYALAAVFAGGALVLAAALCSFRFGADAAAFRVGALSRHLVIAFRPDGPGLVFGAILGVLWPATTVYSLSYMEHEERKNLFYGFFILSFGVVVGIAYSANFFTLYLCYEFMTLSTLPLVMHGMDGAARHAGRLYVLYSATGAALIFICIVVFCRYTDSLDFALGGILDPALIKGHEGMLRTVFVLAFFGFGVKAALFPFYRWLPAASVAPTPVTALLHAVAVVKSGAFAVMRLVYFGFGCALLRGTWAQDAALAAASFTIIFGSAMALRTPHLKRRLAYSTVANLSYILLAFASMDAQGMQAGLLHMVYHALCKITLFFCAGAMLHHNRFEYVYELEGLGRRMPLTCAAFTVSGVALIGIPPFGNFLSKWLTAAAAAASGGWAGHFGPAALVFSAVMTALYMLGVVVRMFFPLRTAPALPEDTREADRLMTGTLIFLCALLLALSLLSAPLSAWIGGMT